MVAQRTRSAPAADGPPISVEELLRFIQTAEKETNRSTSGSLLASLQSATKLTEQQKLLQQQCKALVVKALSTGIVNDDLLAYVKILLFLYLHPNYQALRSNLEWLVEALSSHKMDSSPFHPVLLDVMLRIYRTASDGGVLSTSPVEITIEWAKSLSYAAELDKECRFIASDGELGLEFSPLCLFLTYIEEIMSMCVKQVCYPNQLSLHPTTQPTTAAIGTITTTSTAATSSSAEVSRYIECCGECMRATTTVLKTRRNTVLEDFKYSNNTSSTMTAMASASSTATAASTAAATLDTNTTTSQSAWTLVTNRILTHSLAVLRSDIVHKVIPTQPPSNRNITLA